MMAKNTLWETSGQLSLNIYAEDKASFVPDMNFSITQQQCEDALNQLSNSNNNTINVELASDWLAMHQSLKEDTLYYLLHGGIIKNFR